MGLCFEKPHLDRSGIRTRTTAFAQPLWQGSSAICSTRAIAMKDVVGFQAESGDYKKVVLAHSDLMMVVNARSSHCIVVECSYGDVPYKEGLLRVANGGTGYYVWESHYYLGLVGPEHWGWGIPSL